MMTLKRFRVTNFRSIIDSGWVECDDVTSLVGINEAGKSNVILALWKLKPVRDGEIDMLHDMPTKQYNIELNEGWKVDLSRNVKQQLSKAKSISDDFVEKWVKLFQRFES